jgi:hypothetical protein
VFGDQRMIEPGMPLTRSLYAQTLSPLLALRRKVSAAKCLERLFPLIRLITVKSELRANY